MLGKLWPNTDFCLEIPGEGFREEEPGTRVVREGSSWPRTGTRPKVPLPPPSILCCETDVLLTSTLVVTYPYVNLFIVPVTPVFWGHHSCPRGMLWHGTNETWEGGWRGCAQNDGDSRDREGFPRSAVPGPPLFLGTL